MSLTPATLRSVTLRVVLASASLLVACARSELEVWPLETTPRETASGGTAGKGAAGAVAVDSHGGSPAGGRSGEGARAGTGARSAGGRATGGRGGEGNRAGSTSEPRGGRGAGGKGGRGGNSAGAAGVFFGGRGGVGGSPAAGAGGQSPPTPLAQCDFALTPNLEGPPPLALATTPESAVSGDFDGDGKLDLATANLYGSVTVLLGRGDGTFAPAHDYATHLESTSPVSGFVTAADLDQNGTLDLVVSAESSFLSILWGAGDGTFDASDTYAFYTDVTAVVLGDFDGDAAVDITVATAPRNGDTELQFLRNTGHGVFDGTVVTKTTRNVQHLAAADMNEDGHLDLASNSDDEIVIFLGDGQGKFGSAGEYHGTAYPSSLRSGDFNADGHVDLAVPYRCGMELFPSSAVHLLLGNGDGSFGADTSYPITHCLGDILVDHVNGDAALDVIANATSVLLGAGDGSLLPEVQSPDVRGGTLLAGGDWNGDGKLDIAVLNGNWLAVHLGNGDGTFGSTAQAATGIEPTALALADFDQDGVLDIATSNYDSRSIEPSAGTVSILRGDGHGSFPSHVDYQAAGPPHHLVSADVNGDGWIDLLMLQNYETLGVMLGTGDGVFGPPVSYDAGVNASALALGDVNGDGKLDAVAANTWAGGLSLLFGNGDGTFSPAVSLSLGGHPADVTLLDLDGDAQLDIGVCDNSTGSVSILFGDGHGNFPATRTYPTYGTPVALRGADLNGDRLTDLVIATGSTVSIRLGSGNGELGDPTDYDVAGTYLTLTDFDQDGRPDIVVNSPGLAIMLGFGDGTFTCLEEFAPGVTMTNARVADLNHDARLDVVTATYGGVDVFLNSSR